MLLQYNGCKWRGGVLRVERADVGHLARLEEQWAEEAEEEAVRPEDRAAAAEPPPASERLLRITRPGTGKASVRSHLAARFGHPAWRCGHCLQRGLLPTSGPH